jgi:hypothetical protein
LTAAVIPKLLIRLGEQHLNRLLPKAFLKTSNQ